MTADLARLADVLRQADSIVLTTHQNPDGDGLGSELALHEALTSLGKSVTVLNDGALPAAYAFLDKAGVLQRYARGRHRAVLRAAGLVLMVDVGEPPRAGRLAPDLASFPNTTAILDHHPGRGWGDVAVIDTAAASTTVLVHDLLLALGLPLTPTIAAALYVGLLIDRAMLAAKRLDESAAEGLVERLRDVHGAQVSLLFVEEGDAQTRVSFRSRAPIEVETLAREFGGGGHRLASGAIVQRPLADTARLVRRRARALLRSQA